MGQLEIYSTLSTTSEDSATSPTSDSSYRHHAVRPPDTAGLCCWVRLPAPPSRITASEEPVDRHRAPG